jgi:hypothetical protein
LILSTIEEMPQGDGYSTRRDAFDALLARIQLNPWGALTIRHDLRAPSFCSGASWNANGPGIAGLFHDLSLGENFADDGFYEARAGDFLKIFWKWGQGVGRYEKGHSVVYTRVIPTEARGRHVQKVCFWSSHGFEDGRESGMGEKCVPRSDIQEMIFSRLKIRAFIRHYGMNRQLRIGQFSEFCEIYSNAI